MSSDLVAGPDRSDHEPFDQVVIVGGHMIDAPGRTEPRFPPSAEAHVTASIATDLERWAVGPHSLVISGAARGGDIVAAERARSRGATVWLLVSLPDDRFVEESVRLEGTDWEARYRALRAECPTWFQAEVHGAAPSDEAAFARNNRWMLDVARSVAPPGGVRVLLVWDGREGDGEGGTAHLAAEAEATGADVAVVTPLAE